jgi:hypothetical protein
MEKQNGTQLEVLKNFEFAKTPVMAGIVHTGEMIAVRPCIENLGLNVSGALRQIKANHKFSQLCTNVYTQGKDGKNYEINSWVESTNSFGAVLRTPWKAKVFYDIEGNTVQVMSVEI